MPSTITIPSGSDWYRVVESSPEAIPTFRSSTSEVDIYRIVFLIAGIVIGRMLK